MTIEELEIVIKAKVGDALQGISQVKEAVINCVKQTAEPMKQVANQTKVMAQSGSMNIKQVANQMQNLSNSTKTTSAQQQVLLNKINDLKATLNISRENPKLFSKTEIIEMEAEVEKLQAKLLKLQGSTEKVGNSTNNSFNKGLKAVRRFVFGLVSAGSIFALLSRGMQSYLATNDEANAKYELTSNLIGQMLAPAMKVLLSVIQYVIIGVALLIKMFTGFDALAGLTTKKLKNATSAAKSLNKELTSMDEITNLSDNGGTGISSGLGADLSALDSFSKKVEEVQSLFSKWGIQDIVDKLKLLGKWLWDNRDAIDAVGLSLAAVFGAMKISSLITNIGLLIGGSTFGLTGLLVVLGLIATVWVISLVIKDFDNIKKKLKELYGIKSSIEGKGGGFSSGGGNAGGGGASGGGFATGGVASSPIVGLVAEYPDAKQNPEIISPQSIMRETMMEAFSDILPSMQGSSNGGTTILQINGKEFARAIKKDTDYEDNRVNRTTILRRV